jgi:hypothetical protein
MGSGSSPARTDMRPARVQVLELISSRYGAPDNEMGVRPADWDNRRDGIDQVKLASGEVISLHSSAMQSPPRPGWVLILTGGGQSEGYTWTLYGIPRSH